MRIPVLEVSGYEADDVIGTLVKSKLREGFDVVVLTGDIHSSWAMDLTEMPYDAAMYDPATGEGSLAVEFVTPAITSPHIQASRLKPAGWASLTGLWPAGATHNARA